MREPSSPPRTVGSTDVDSTSPKGLGESDSKIIWEAAYRELRLMARRQLAEEAPVHRNRVTSLIQQVFLRLSGQSDTRWESRAQFFASAAQVMREIRVDDARKRKRLKRGGGAVPLSLDTLSQSGGMDGGLFSDDPDDVLGVNELIDMYAKLEPRKAAVVRLRFFAGMTVPEVAEALALSPRTVDADWRLARAWFFREVSNQRRSE